MMLSGVELAGLVLASLPLVIAALEHYSDGMGTLERWWRYKREVARLVRLLVAEQVLFLGTCEKLLYAVVTPAELELLIELPGGTQWKDPSLDESLRRHLGRAYGSYMACVEDMNAALNDLQAMLQLDPTGKPSWVDDSSFKSQMKRIRISLSPGIYQDALTRLEKNNSVLANLTAQSLELEPVRRRRGMTNTRLKYVQQHAANLYTAIRSCWICGCATQHHAALRLNAHLNESNRQGNESVRNEPVDQDELFFAVVFSTDDAKTTQWSWQETRIRSIRRRMEQINESKTEPKLDMSLSQWQKSSAKLPKKSNLRSLFSRKAKGHQKDLGSIPSSTSKGVKFVDELSQSCVTSTSVVVLNAASGTNMSPTIRNLCRSLQAYQAAGESRSNDDCIGFLECQKQYVLAVNVARRKTLTDGEQRQNIASLRQVILSHGTSTLPVLSRAERLFIALTVATAVLELHHTPWLRERWTLDDILIHINSGEDLRDRVYVSKDFPEPFDFQLAKQDEDHPGVRNVTLFALGIVLIELCLGQTLESMRNQYDPLESNGRVNIVTQWATANRMMLKVAGEAGNRYGDAVRRCLYCEFDQSDTNLHNDRFREAVYQGVVVPLKEIFKEFNQPSVGTIVIG